MEETLIRLAEQYESLIKQSREVAKEFFEKKKNNQDSSEAKAEFYKYLESHGAVMRLFSDKLKEYRTVKDCEWIRINNVIYGHDTILIRIALDEIKELK